MSFSLFSFYSLDPYIRVVIIIFVLAAFVNPLSLCWVTSLIGCLVIGVIVAVNLYSCRRLVHIKITELVLVASEYHTFISHIIGSSHEELHECCQVSGMCTITDAVQVHLRGTFATQTEKLLVLARLERRGEAVWAQT